MPFLFRTLPYGSLGKLNWTYPLVLGPWPVNIYWAVPFISVLSSFSPLSQFPFSFVLGRHPHCLPPILQTCLAFSHHLSYKDSPVSHGQGSPLPILHTPEASHCSWFSLSNLCTARPQHKPRQQATYLFVASPAMSAPIEIAFVAMKRWIREHQARKQAKREQNALESTRKEEIELDGKLSDSGKHETDTPEEATAAVIGLGPNASNDIEPAVARPCRPLVTKKEIVVSPSANAKDDVDIRFVGNPIGVGSYKSFELSVDTNNASSPSPSSSPTSTKFSASSGTTLNDDRDDEEDIFPPISKESPSFDPWTGPELRDWAKGKRKGRANHDEKAEVGALKDWLTHADTESPVLHTWRSRRRALSAVIVRTLTR